MLHIYIYTGWWFGTFCIFHNIWDNPSHWLIFLKMVKTTNQYIYIDMYRYIQGILQNPLVDRHVSHEQLAKLVDVGSLWPSKRGGCGRAKQNGAGYTWHRIGIYSGIWFCKGIAGLRYIIEPRFLYGDIRWYKDSLGYLVRNIINVALFENEWDTMGRPWWRKKPAVNWSYPILGQSHDWSSRC